MLRGAGIVALSLVMLAGCADREERVIFDGNYYPAKSKGEKAERRDFTASVRRVSRGPEGAQKAVLHEATRYCLQNFGTSEIAWADVPAGGEGPVYARSGDSLSVSGRCIIW
ncbi:MAG: hypothetical protein RID11_06690 [Roseovarius sp.]|uniref:hypothetical protein n=1 Tax=Roseovarius sp. TaxID=1486281 RepID=UPI0032EDC086